MLDGGERFAEANKTYIFVVLAQSLALAYIIALKRDLQMRKREMGL